jgi:hypothetical protein
LYLSLYESRRYPEEIALFSCFGQSFLSKTLNVIYRILGRMTRLNGIYSHLSRHKPEAYRPVTTGIRLFPLNHQTSIARVTTH